MEYAAVGQRHGPPLGFRQVSRPERCCCESGGVAVACRSAHGFQLLYSTQIFPFCCISFYIANFHAWILLLDFHVEHFTGQFWHAVKYSGHSKHF